MQRSIPTPVPAQAARHYTRLTQRLQSYGGGAVIFLASLALAGWISGRQELASLAPDFIPMAPNTALAFFALGLGLLALGRERPPTWAPGYAVASAAVIALVCTLRLLELAGVVQLNTDRWVLRPPLAAGQPRPVGEMSLPTALACLCAAASVLVRQALDRQRIAGVLATGVLAIGLVFTLGYLYGAPFFYGERLIPMALPTAVALVALGVGLLMSVGPEAVPLRRLFGQSVHTRLLRAFLPFTLATVALVAWLTFLAQRYQGASSAALLSALLVVAAVVVVSLVCTYIARVVGRELERADRELRNSEQQTRDYAARLEMLNVTLEQRVQERTMDLQATAQAERAAREALEESEARLRAVSQMAHDAIISADSTGAIIQWNYGAEQMFGYAAAEVLGRPLTQLMPERYAEAHSAGLERVRTTGETRIMGRTVEVHGRHKDGREFPVELSLSGWETQQGRFFTAIARDIAERKRAEEQLRVQNARLEESAQSERQAHEALKQAQCQLVQTEKLASLGQLVAGVAHEINNPLSFVTNNVAVLQRDLQPLRELIDLYRGADELLAANAPAVLAQIRELLVRADLDYTLEHFDELMVRSRDGLKRIQQIVTDLRDFARLDESDLHEVDLRDGIDSTLHIIQALARRKDVELITELTPLPAVTCYPAKINQVVLNLVANAIDACPDGGRVTIAAQPRHDGVEIHVRDNGPGVPAAIRERIFDPFFTTKPPGQGTGLGLSISYQIVQEHGGSIELEQPNGGGAHFVVFLPFKPALAETQRRR